MSSDGTRVLTDPDVARGDGHHCSTGAHEEPFYTCYSVHGCRCDGCREAATEYQRRYRAEVQSDEQYEVDLQQKRAYHAAQKRLRESHEAEFRRIYEQERARRGLEASDE